jgi:hypothetical protein
MKSSKFLFLLLPGIVSFSCKKDDDTPITYPSAYHKSEIKTAGDLRIFSSTGEIRDPVITGRCIVHSSPQPSDILTSTKNN